MILEHSSFLKPANQNQKIWRYVDLTKFMDFLNTQSIYFTRLDKFNDVFEGSIYLKTAKNKRTKIQTKLSNGQIIDRTYEFLENQEYEKQSRKKFGVNCWHMNDYESAAMWKLYLKSSEGIAIQSSFKKLRTALNKSKVNFFIGTVSYIDYEKDDIEFENSFVPIVHKRKSFSHENELRAIIPIEEPGNSKRVDLENGGCKIKVDINKLVENIYISPDSPEWLSELVSDICKKYGFDFNVINSKLNDNPIY